MSKPVVENIYPLSSLQQAMLLHRLQAPIDQGLLQVSCQIKGNVDTLLLAKAWQLVVDRHEVLRSSLHHEKVEKPVQVVRQQVHSVIEIVHAQDWSKEKLEQWKDEQLDLGLDFLKPPISRLAVVQEEVDGWLLCWLCHHILVDGWSTTIILKDLFRVYQDLIDGVALHWDPLPPHGNYLSWKKAQDLSELSQIYPGGLGRASKSSWLKGGSAEAKFADVEIRLPSQLGSDLKELAKSWQVSLNVLYQMSWAFFLARQNDEGEVRYGLTVSGRSGGLKQLDEMTGLYMNVLPVIQKMEGDGSVKDVATKLQKWLLRAVQYDHLTLTEIASHLDADDFALNTLFTFENLPWSSIHAGGLEIDSFSGGITSNYPIALVVIPGSEPLLIFHYNESIIDRQEIRSIAGGLQDALTAITRGSTVADLIAELPKLGVSESPSIEMSESRQLDYVPPTTQAELTLTRLWESVLRQQPVGVEHDFFALGGKSLDAIRLFTHIHQEFGQHLSPALLLERSTIRELASLLGGQKEQTTAWSSLVPLRAHGSKPPLFCIHAGGAHVFFYHGLMQHLDDDQPVYGIQPSGLDGISETESSIEEMAAAYYREMRLLLPHGPFCLLGYCFSVPVCIEIDKLIRAEGAGESLVLVIDSGPWFDGDEQVSMAERLGKLVTIARNRNWQRLSDIIEDKSKKIRSRYLKNVESKHAADLLAMENQLREIYQAYQWKPFDGSIELLRSREYAERADKAFHAKEWERLAREGLSVTVIEGRHKSLFESPDVIHLAQAVQKKINELSVEIHEGAF